MMTSHEDFPSNDLVCRPIMNDGVSSKFLTTRRALKITLSIVRRYHIDKYTETLTKKVI